VLLVVMDSKMKQRSTHSNRETQKRRLRTPQQQRWYEEVKCELLRTEPLNIAARATACTSLINETIAAINALLQLPAVPKEQRFVSSVRGKEAICEHLPFLLHWPGLRTDASTKRAASKKEYEKKSKNWLNGRRAPNYAKTLFPRFIHDAEAYARTMAAQLIGGRDEAAAAKRKLYEDVVMYGVLERLCGCMLSLHEQAKKAPFFCKNSLERKGPLRQLLQGYANDHEYVQGFPSCAEAAVGYFHKKYEALCREFQRRYLALDDHPDSTASLTSSPRVDDSHEDRLQTVEYWKTQYQQLEREIAAVRSERDHFKSMLEQCQSLSPPVALAGRRRSSESVIVTTSMSNAAFPGHGPYGASATNAPVATTSAVHANRFAVSHATSYDAMALRVPVNPVPVPVSVPVQSQTHYHNNHNEVRMPVHPPQLEIGDTSNDSVVPPTPDVFSRQFSHDIFAFPSHGSSACNPTATMSMCGDDAFALSSPPAFMCTDSEPFGGNPFEMI